MRRDMDLVRHILIKVGESDEAVTMDELATSTWDENIVGYHLQLMSHHGLVDCEVTRDMGGDVIDCTVEGLTWDGCDYLDAIADKDVWKVTKKTVREAVGSTTLGVIKQTAVMVAIEMVKAKLGITS